MAESPRFEPGDVVKYIQDEQALRDLQKGHGGWRSDMSNILGKLGTVKKVYPDGDIKVKVNRFTAIYNPYCVQLIRKKDEVDAQLLTVMSSVDSEVSIALAKPDDLELGDKIRVLDDDEAVRKLQQGYGGWVTDMNGILGQEGVICVVYKDGSIRIEVNRKRWTLNPACLRLVSKRSQDDVRYLSSLSAKECSQHKSSIEGLQPGDGVRIIEEEKAVIELQREFGGWVSAMKNILGQEGIIKEIFEDGRVRVEVKGDIWSFNEKCLQNVPYRKEMNEEELTQIKEFSENLTMTDINHFNKVLVVPRVLSEISEPYDLLIALMSWSGHNPLLFYQALQEIRPDLVSLASEILRLCDESVSELDCIRYLIKMLKAELSINEWNVIGSYFSIEVEIISDVDTLLHKLFEGGVIQKDLNKLLALLSKLERIDLTNKVNAYQNIFSEMDENEFNQMFKTGIANQTIELNQRDEDLDSNKIPIDHARFNTVYHHNKHSVGLALFIVFDIVNINRNQYNKIYRKMNESLSDFNIVCRLITTNKNEMSKKEFLDEFEDVLSRIESNSYSFLIVFPIGDIAPTSYHNDTLAYVIKDIKTTTIDVISPEVINAIIYKQTTIPVIVMYTWISENNHIPTHPIKLCANTFFCFVSSTNALPQEKNTSQIIQSIYQVLREYADESLLLMEFFTDTRNHFFNNLPQRIKKNRHREPILYITNTIRNPLVIKMGGLSKLNESDPSNLSTGFFFIAYRNKLEGKWEEMEKLTDELKVLFKNMNYTIGKDVLLSDGLRFSQQLEINKGIGNNCRLIFVLVMTTNNTDNHSTFGDKFSNELAITFPIVPKIIFIHQKVETLDKTLPLPVKKHSLIVHSIESKFSENSFINNFVLEIQRNYFAEMHTIIRNTVVCSTESSSIQLMDGFRKNFYIHYDCHLAHLLNKNSKEFRENYEKACKEGTTPLMFYRLMILGPEGIGKTSLLRVLTGQPFQENEESTQFIAKYDLQVQKLSHDWSKVEHLDSFMQNIEETSEDLTIKAVAKNMLKPQISKTKLQIDPMKSINDLKNIQNDPIISPAQDYVIDTKKELSNPKKILRQQKYESISVDKQQYDSKIHSPEPISPTPEHKIMDAVPSAQNQEKESKEAEKMSDSKANKQIKSSLDRIHSLGSRSEFFTAWDFAGQNYLYCFHSLFLSPRSVYLLLVDLTIKDLKDKLYSRHREDRHDRRSMSGVPTTYIEVYEFWLNAIYSVNKKVIADGYDTSTSNVIFVFNKADLVENPLEVAKKHFETIKTHVNRKNNSFSLVYKENDLFLLSCKKESIYFANVSTLKYTIKRLSDKVSYKEPVPIRWLRLANEVLKEDQPILDKFRIQELAEIHDCSRDLHHFLQFFNAIGFFFYKQGKIIIAIQKFLSLIYNVLFPQYMKGQEDIPNHILNEIHQCNTNAILSRNLFLYILDCMNLRRLREPLLELLQTYGILIRCNPKEVIPNSFHVPYLLTGFLEDFKETATLHPLRHEFFIYFADGFLPLSLYFTLLSECLRKNFEQDLSQPTLGFDCALFYICEYVVVSFSFSQDRSNILIYFYTLDSDYEEENEKDIISEIMHYLTFLQLSLVEIQSTLIPCGIPAKVMLECEYCKTLTGLENGERPACSLDTIFTTNSKEISLLVEELNKEDEDSENNPVEVRFCCIVQLEKVRNYIRTVEKFSNNDYNAHDNVLLAELIVNNRNKFIKHLKWRQISSVLYSSGLITIQRYATIINSDIFLGSDICEEVLMEMVHKGPLWAIKLYFALRTSTNDCGHRTLLKFLDANKKSRSGTLPKNIRKDRRTGSILRNITRVYNMNRNRHGIAFIVNIEFFSDEKKFPRRDGSKCDVEALKCVFEFLQYDTRVYENLTRKEYIKLQQEIQAYGHSEYDSFFCVIMSHGNDKGEVIFSNDKPLSKENIVSEFSPRYCVGLEAKPKIFLFQACRGKERQLVKIASTENPFKKGIFPADFFKEDKNFDTNVLDSIPNTNVPYRQIGGVIDTFIGDSTVNQYVSFRSKSTGTFFIQSFCSVLQSCSNMEFTHIMMEVRRKVSLISGELKQCTEDTNRLKGQVYF